MKEDVLTVVMVVSPFLTMVMLHSLQACQSKHFQNLKSFLLIHNLLPSEYQLMLNAKATEDGLPFQTMSKKLESKLGEPVVQEEPDLMITTLVVPADTLKD